MFPPAPGWVPQAAFLVGLLHALHAYKRRPVAAEVLAREAFDIEMNRLGMPVGKQDHYIAAYGGLACQDYRPDEGVVITPLHMSEQAILELRDSLMLFFVGYTRAASNLLQEQKKRSEQGDASMLESLHFAKRLGLQIKDLLESGDTTSIGRTDARALDAQAGPFRWNEQPADR